MWQERKSQEIIDGTIAYFRDKVASDPKGTMTLVEQELQSQLVFLGNDWLGRGIVMDTVITATINALEIVRVDCLEKIKKS
ncbi:MAG: hypothetical protein H8E41_10370 [Desulfobulbaceae bacterium]|uniref:Uncharacterized protein n=1 Tax=Candidatus Desulfobia pelagia TaxID=2841692 RepID=A0A8J6NE17_9BACT|nr:hypothetical protein [Candidatus Desulfobia pelagia]